MSGLTRRDLLKAGAAAGLLQFTGAGTAAASPMLLRPIPSTDEPLPVIGLGTWGGFDVGPSESDREALQTVLFELVEGGGSVIDTAPMYGRAERVVGDLVRNLDIRDQTFLATKVWSTGKNNGRREIEQSFSLLRADTIDLYQVHNVRDLDRQIGILRELKQDARVRYIGVTHYVSSEHDRLAQIIRTQKLDFLQFNYSMADRAAEIELLPLCAELGVATIINRPYQDGALFRRTRNVELPGWAADFDCRSWGQFFLKYLLGHEAVTCVIPGTARPRHMLDNLEAGRGRMPDGRQRARMVEFFQQL